MRSFAVTALGLCLAAPAWLEFAGSGGVDGVSANTGASRLPSMAIDALGRPWIAWEDHTTEMEICLRTWNGSAWVGVGGSESGGGLSDTPGNSESPSLALDSAGRPVVAWSQSQGIYVRRWNGASWVPYGGSDTGLGIADGVSSFLPKLKLDSADHPVVVWNHYPPTVDPAPTPPSQIYLKRWNGTAWVELAGSASGGGISNAGQFAEEPSLALDAADLPVVTWGHADVQGNGLQIYVKRWNGAAWVEYGGSATGSGMSGAGSSGQSPCVVLESSGNPVVAWHEYGLSGAGLGEIYVRRWTGLAWEGLGGSDSGGGISASGGTGARFASLALDASGRPAVAWQNGPLFVSDEIFFRRWDGIAWIEQAGSGGGGGISGTAGPSGAVSLAYTPAGDPAVAWNDGPYPGDSEVLFRAFSATGVLPPAVDDDDSECGFLGVEGLALAALLARWRRRRVTGPGRGGGGAGGGCRA